MKNGSCPKCGSTEIMANLTVRDKGHRNIQSPTRVTVDEPEPAEKDLLWISDGASGQLRAWICSQCGYTELYTDNLEKMYKKYKQYKLDK